MSSVASADSDSTDLHSSNKRPPSTSPTLSPQPKRPRPDDAWNHPPDDSSSPKIQLPSIFSAFQDPFHRRASLPTLSSARAPSRPAAAPTPSGLASYQFPPQSEHDDKAHARPRLNADTQLGLYADQSPLPSATTLSSLTTASSASTSPSFSSAFSSPLSSDYALPRAAQGLPALQFPDSESWNPSSSASLPGIVRPSSTPGNPPIKYEDSLRHSSLTGSYSFPPAQQQQQQPQVPMYGSVARIAGQSERRASYAQSQTADALKDDWNFPPSDFLVPSASSNGSGATPSPSRSPTGAVPAPSSLVDRPQKKRGKLPKPTTDFLKDWLHRHSDHPYPSEEEKKQLCAATGLSMSQVSNWMINARRRILAPVHRPSSGPATTHPLPTQAQRLHPGVSSSTLLRRASMPTDSLQLYHPLSLQSIPHAGGGALAADYYTAPGQRSVLLGSGYSQGRSQSYGGYPAQGAGYSFPTPAAHHQQSSSGYLPNMQMGAHNGAYAQQQQQLSHGNGAGQGFYQQSHYGAGAHQEREHNTPTPASGPGTGYHTPQ
ncbi:hypothetical protein FA95DRAFT_1554889 [Auriscalpium vulgare]|uniref:Uncharacterized protein n=1 Tax=Auriscalpium vulgare TaxID=40419 RepID=A0ACB8S4P7_9AGAM|nr:hypothetical protein FA95DRAFT_1554889 [Auriscalpium vulgare]